ncbi:MAG: YihY family inner membrane protein [Proteobacteria bacterium]|nr:YihY family inner membrane protein [Pseudomonadota bacterium]
MRDAAPSKHGLIWSAGQLIAAVARRFVADRSVQTAGSLTFTTLLSLVPMITVALSMTTAFPVFDSAISALQDYLVKHFLPGTDGVEAIATQINAFTQRAGRLTAIGLGFLAITSLMLMLTIEESMNRVFRVQRRRPLAQRILMYWSVLTLGPVLIGASLSMTSFAIGASLGMLDLGGLAQGLLRLVPFLFTCAALAMIYILVPFRRIEWQHAAVGAVFAGIMFELAKRAFAFYIAQFPTYTLIYGAFATIPIFLLWVYVSWLVVMAGATITAVLPGWHGAAEIGRRAPGQELLEALRVLRALARAQREGQVLTLSQLARSLRILPHRCERVLERAAVLGWTAHTEREGWLLARDAATLRVADVYSAFALAPETVARVDATLGESFDEHWKRITGDMAMDLKTLAGEAPAK